jgi:hypothetical protein
MKSPLMSTGRVFFPEVATARLLAGQRIPAHEFSQLDEMG